MDNLNNHDEPKGFMKSTNQFETINGKHLLLEIYGANQEKLNDESYLRCIIGKSSKLANAKILNLISHKFNPQGVTAIALLAESHLSIHTWPELRYCAIDIFTCGNNMEPLSACKYLIDALEAENHFLRTINRSPTTKTRQAIETLI